MPEFNIGISFDPYGKTYARYRNNKFLELQRHGYGAVDYNIADTNIELYTLSDTALKEKIQQEKDAANAAGIIISQVHGPWRWPPQDLSENDRAERLEKMKKAVVITALLDCKHLVIHPIMPYGIEDQKSGNADRTWAMNVAYFKTLVAFAKSYDVTICLENMPMRDFSISTPSQILEFVKMIGDDHLKICFDTGHVAIFPQLSAGDEIRKLGNYIKCFHLHDNLGAEDSHLYPTKGILDWTDIADAINEIGYPGVISLETAPSADYDDIRFTEESIQLNQLCKTLIPKKFE